MGPLKKTRCEVKNRPRKTVENSLVHVFIHIQMSVDPRKANSPLISKYVLLATHCSKDSSILLAKNKK